MEKSAGTREPLPRTGPALLAPVFVDALGSGLCMAVSVVFLTRCPDLGSSEVGLGLGVAGAVSFALLVPTGILADRAASPLVQGVFGAAVEAGQRVRATGMARSLQNLGLSLGGLAAAGALLWDSDGVYLAVVFGTALSFVLAAALVARLRAVGSSGGRPLPWRRRLAVFRDRPFTGLTVLNSVVSLHVTVLTVGIPLWVLAHDELPRSVIAWTLVLNTVVVVLFQVRATRGIESAEDGGGALRLSGLLLAAGCCALAATGELPTAWAVAVLLGAVALQAFAEMHQQAGARAISYDLAPKDRRPGLSGLLQSGQRRPQHLRSARRHVSRGAARARRLAAARCPGARLRCLGGAGRPSAASGAQPAPAVSLTYAQGETHGTHP